ncbi:MAG: protein kinase [Deltaproteobacteria bacterium]|nr:protein kinase [Deltaproteobacteria bacterium]
MVLSGGAPGSAAAARDPWIGRVLHEKYVLTRLLGDGGMGAVYEAVQGKIGRKVAVKVLHTIMARTERARVRFEVEARAAAAIVHPNIVEVLDFGELDDGGVYLVMELLEGNDLGAELSGSPLPLGRTLHITRQVCSALDAIHAKGVVHRDLKPANVFLTARGGDTSFVKVLDFGVAKVVQAEGGLLSAHTATGQIMGTPMYMSPEQARGLSDVDRRTDLYALGAIVFEMLTGRPLFDSPSVPDLLLQICHGRQPRLREHRPDLPPELDAIVARMIERDRALRYPTAGEIAAALAAIALDDVPSHAPSSGPAATVASIDVPAHRLEELAVAATEPDTASPVSDLPPRPAAAVQAPPDASDLLDSAVERRPRAGDASVAPHLPQRSLRGWIAAGLFLSAGAIVTIAVSSSRTTTVNRPPAPNARPSEPVAPRESTPPIALDPPAARSAPDTIEAALHPEVPGEAAAATVASDDPRAATAERPRAGRRERPTRESQAAANPVSAPPAIAPVAPPDPPAEPARPSEPPPAAPAPTEPRPAGQRDIIRLVVPDRATAPR